MKRHAILVLLAFLAASPAAAETVAVEASRDATMIEDPDGALANGSGPVFFVGRNNQTENSVRRGLLYFDVAAAVPREAIVESATLTLYMTPSNSQSSTLTLYRVQTDWGEGSSAASGGGGAASEPGDVTWLHTFYDTDFWSYSGGQFIGRASAEQVVTAAGFYTWDSNRHLVQDVRLWKSAPQRNFGWIIIGDETTRQTAKSFSSREDPDPALRPLLEVTYRMPGVRPRR